METAEIPSGAAASAPATQDLSEQAVELAVTEQVRSQGLARAVEWRNGIRSDLAFESSHKLVRTGLEAMFASPAAAAGAETVLVRYAEERGIAAALDRFMRKPHRFGRLAGDKAAARKAARELAPQVSAYLIERATRYAGTAPGTEGPTELTPAQVRREREDRVLRAAARDRLRAAAARRWGFNADDEYTNLLPLGRNVLERNPNGTVREYLAEPGALLQTIPPYSDVATRRTFVADRYGIPRLVPAEEAQTPAELRPVEIPLERGRLSLPFESPARRLRARHPAACAGARSRTRSGRPAVPRRTDSTPASPARTASTARTRATTTSARTATASSGGSRTTSSATWCAS